MWVGICDLFIWDCVMLDIGFCILYSGNWELDFGFGIWDLGVWIWGCGILMLWDSGMLVLEN